MAFSVSMPVTLSTRNAWFSAPRWNFSSSRRRNSGVDGDRDRDVERQRAEHDPGQHRRVEEHHRQEDDGEEQVDDQGQRRAGEEVADVLQLAHPRHRIADAARLEVGQRQGQQVAEQPRAELDVDAVGGVGEQIGAQDAQHGLERRRSPTRPITSTSSVVERAVHQHLVDHDLEEQRRDQARRAAGRTRRPAPRPAGGDTCGSRPGTR